MLSNLCGAQVAITIIELLKEEMDGSDRLARRKSLKERLISTGIGCCGCTWGQRPCNIRVPEEEEEDEEGPTEVVLNVEVATPEMRSTPPVCAAAETPGRSGMNLAAALAAEREFRAADEGRVEPSPSPSPVRPNRTAPGTPYRVSLMRLLEETEAREKEASKGGDVVGCDSVCCVCMVRKKDAAFIPCGHTFCRVCSREVWLNRGTCPLCNRSIVEILDIF